MRAAQESFLAVLGRANVQYVVPVFQRVYSWTARECEELFDDVMRSAVEGTSHFVGTYLYSKLGVSSDGLQKYQVIDGQQRSTTILLMIKAFVDALRAKDGADSYKAEKIEQEFLLCKPVNSYDVQPKLKLTSIDGDMLSYLLGLCDQPEDISARLQENLALFKQRMLSSDFDREMFWRGCEMLQVIAIELTQDDSPQEVFESLNSKGKRLAVEDLVRNAILSQSYEGGAAEIYEQMWIPLEEEIENAKGISMEDALCSWIASKHPEVYIDSKSEVYPLFKDDLMVTYKGDTRKLISDLASYASMFTSNEQWRRERMTELDRWLQGKPKSIISERKMFGD